jgi:hypothetical protein
MEHVMSGQENLETDDQGDENRGRGNRNVAGELRSLEARLASLSPRPDRLDRDRLMFLAGQASLAEVNVSRTTILGVKLASRAWPTAFAAMSAVAATLLGILIARPENSVRQPLPSSASLHQAEPRIAVERSSNELMLSPLDARIDDIDRWLMRNELRPDRTDPSVEPFQTSRLPILTPARWEQVLNDGEPLDASPSGAFNIRQHQGARS